MRKAPKRDRILALLKQGWEPKAIARQCRCSLAYVLELRKHQENPAAIRDRRRKWEAENRRRLGVRSRAEHDAKARAQAAKRFAAVKPLLARGLSYRRAGERLGLTRNQIAGLKHRAKLAAEARP